MMNNSIFGLYEIWSEYEDGLGPIRAKYQWRHIEVKVQEIYWCWDLWMFWRWLEQCIYI